MRTAIMLIFLVGLAAWFGYLLADAQGLLIALAVAIPYETWRLLTNADAL